MSSSTDPKNSSEDKKRMFESAPGSPERHAEVDELTKEYGFSSIVKALVQVSVLSAIDKDKSREEIEELLGKGIQLIDLFCCMDTLKKITDGGKSIPDPKRIVITTMLLMRYASGSTDKMLSQFVNTCEAMDLGISEIAPKDPK